MKGIGICPLSSGSSGNSVLVVTDSAKILVDCGITGKAVENELQDIGVSPKELDAIIVTHEHIDHISGVGIMSRRYHLPIYSTFGTWQAMINSLGKIDVSLIRYIAPDVPFKINSTIITPFQTSHDAAESIGLLINDSESFGAILTDLGTVSRHIYDLLVPCSILMIEANHDEQMLKAGPYPISLKQRILSDNGHLSNRLCGALCAKLVKEGKLKKIMLGHLSSDNNTPRLAYETVANSIENTGCKIGSDVLLYVANRNSRGEMMVDAQ